MLCDRKACAKAYHLACLGLRKRPFGESRPQPRRRGPAGAGAMGTGTGPPEETLWARRWGSGAPGGERHGGETEVSGPWQVTKPGKQADVPERCRRGRGALPPPTQGPPGSAQTSGSIWPAPPTDPRLPLQGSGCARGTTATCAASPPPGSATSAPTRSARSTRTGQPLAPPQMGGPAAASMTRAQSPPPEPHSPAQSPRGPRGGGGGGGGAGGGSRKANSSGA